MGSEKCMGGAMPSVEELYNKGLDDTFMYDLSSFEDYAYTNKVFKFAEFALFHESTVFKKNGSLGNYVQFQALTITKKKSAKALAKKRIGEQDFFAMQFPIRRLKAFVRAAELLMFVNKIKPLPLEEEDEEMVEEGRMRSREDKERKKRMVLRANKKLVEKLGDLEQTEQREQREQTEQTSDEEIDTEAETEVEDFSDGSEQSEDEDESEEEEEESG